MKGDKMDEQEDRRPDPKPRKYATLWQAYLWWNEMVEIRKRHTLRISSSERGKSNLNAQFEQVMMDKLDLDARICELNKMMIEEGQETGRVWDWLTSIKGLKAGGLAAQLIAQIDQPPETISKLWRFAGWAVIDGQAERNQRGEKSHYNRQLKSICWLIVDQFIKHQTPVYADIYYEEKERQRKIHPETLCRECTDLAVRTNRSKMELRAVVELDELEPLALLLDELTSQDDKYGVRWEDCPSKKSHHRLYNDGHVHNRAIRKTAKIFLQHLWLVWREAEGLPVSKPWVEQFGGHVDIIPPPNWPLETAS
jgi:hypothetical protein